MNSSKEQICTFVSKKKINLKKVINFFSSIQNTNEIIKLSNRAFDFYSDPISKKEELKIRKFCYKNKIDLKSEISASETRLTYAFNLQILEKKKFFFLIWMQQLLKMKL